MPSVDYDAARKLLDAEFRAIESASLAGIEPNVPKTRKKHFDIIFESQTQAYREVLLGCILARLIDRKIDIHKPYVNQGEGAYNGRTLDERVVNPFLHEKRIPSSRGPFLAAFRRSVMFDRTTREGMRDKQGYDSLLALIDLAAKTNDETALRTLLGYLLFRFIQMRIAAEVPLSKLQRISLEQYNALIDGLLSVPSGGRFPVMLAEATFQTLKTAHNLDWVIDVQGINVADRPSGAGGDITIRSGDAIVLAAEVTERPLDKSRIISTFQIKIAPQGIEDYLFLIRGQPDDEVMRQARQYFSQGHEVNFLELKNWILVTLATAGKAGRAFFNQALLAKLSDEDVPAALKVAWNTCIDKLTTAE